MAAASALRQVEAHKPGVYINSQPTEKLANAIRNCSRLQNWAQFFKPLPALAISGHMSTIVPALLRSPAQSITYKRQLVQCDDGGQCSIDVVDEAGSQLSEAHTVFVLIPGLGGNSHDPYVTRLAALATRAGSSVCAVNMRGCGSTALTTPRFFSARRGSVDDIRNVCEHIRAQTPEDARLVAIGWSNGGTVLSHVLADSGAGCEDGSFPTPSATFDGAVCAAVPFNLKASCANLSRPFHRAIYDRRITSRITKEMQLNADVFRQQAHATNGVDIESALEARYLVDLDDRLTRRTFGYASVAEYYEHSSADKRIHQITTPTLFVSSLDDPISISTSIPFAAVQENPNVALVATQSGGHLGWPDELNGLDSTWVNHTMLDFLHAVVHPREQDS